MHLDFKGHQVFSIMVQTMMSEYPLFPGVSAGGSSPSKRRVLRGRMGLQRRQQKDESHLQPFALGFLDIYPCSHPGSPGSYGRHGWWHPNSHSKLQQLPGSNLRLSVNCCQHLIIPTSGSLSCSASLATPLQLWESSQGNTGEGGKGLRTSPNVILAKGFRG